MAPIHGGESKIEAHTPQLHTHTHTRTHMGTIQPQTHPFTSAIGNQIYIRERLCDKEGLLGEKQKGAAHDLVRQEALEERGLKIRTLAFTKL